MLSLQSLLYCIQFLGYRNIMFSFICFIVCIYGIFGTDNSLQNLFKSILHKCSFILFGVHQTPLYQIKFYFYILFFILTSDTIMLASAFCHSQPLSLYHFQFITFWFFSENPCSLSSIECNHISYLPVKKCYSPLTAQVRSSSKNYVNIIMQISN